MGRRCNGSCSNFDFSIYSLRVTQGSSAQAAQEYKAMLAKRDADNARLREQREQLNAELIERRQKDYMKHASLQEYKSLVDSNSVCD
jgi:hypothetical protein